MREQGLTFHSA